MKAKFDRDGNIDIHQAAYALTERGEPVHDKAFWDDLQLYVSDLGLAEWIEESEREALRALHARQQMRLSR